MNDKIEGFFTICQRRGLTGKQGVIIPATTIQQLSLSDEVVEAVKMSNSLFIKSRIFIKQLKILFDRDLLEEKEEYVKGKEPIARFNSKSNCFPFGNAEKKLVRFL